jgi:hypothetical protein
MKKFIMKKRKEQHASNTGAQQHAQKIKLKNQLM